MSARPSRIASSLALAVATIQLVGSFGAAANQPDRRGIDAVAAVLVLAGPVALAWRERWPAHAAIVTAVTINVYIALGYPFGPVFISFVLALFFVVQSCSRTVTLGVTVVSFTGFMIASVVDDRPSQPIFVHLALVAGWLLVVVAMSEIVRVRREQAAARVAHAEDELRRRNEQLRLHIAHDVHDVVAHSLSMISVQAGVALHLLDEHPEQALPALTAIKAASHDGLVELRQALDVLRTGDAAPRGPTPGVEDLDELVAGVRGPELDVRLELSGDASALPAAVSHAVYRVVQESLTNVSRHAHARRVDVTVRIGGGVAVAEVTDDGRGGVVRAGNGITGMRQRAVALGGALVVGPAPRVGTRVTLSIPADVVVDRAERVDDT